MTAAEIEMRRNQLAAKKLAALGSSGRDALVEYLRRPISLRDLTEKLMCAARLAQALLR
jgi:hypothetical protein